MLKAKLNNISIHYRSMGQGSNVVLIHGLGASQGFWSPRILLPLARKYRVNLFDLRGHGYSEMPAKGYALADFARDLLALLDYLHIPQADLLGHSFGGVIALQTAISYPERVRSITLADTKVRSLQPPAESNQLMESEMITRKLAEAGITIPEGEKEAGLWLLEKFASPLKEETRKKLSSTEPFVPFLKKNGKNRSAERWLQLLQRTSAKQEIIDSSDLTLESLAQINQPILAMCGESNMTRHSVQELQKNLSRCQSFVIPGAGHFFPLTHTELFLNTAMQFLDKVNSEDFRKYERFFLRLMVQVRVNGSHRFSAETTNISTGGLLIETPRKINIGSEIEILSQAAADDRSPLPVKGRVIREEKSTSEKLYRFGIELSPGALNYEDWQAFSRQHSHFVTNIIDTSAEA